MRTDCVWPRCWTEAERQRLADDCDFDDHHAAGLVEGPKHIITKPSCAPGAGCPEDD